MIDCILHVLHFIASLGYIHAWREDTLAGIFAFCILHGCICIAWGVFYFYISFFLSLFCLSLLLVASLSNPRITYMYPLIRNPLRLLIGHTNNLIQLFSGCFFLLLPPPPLVFNKYIHTWDRKSMNTETKRRKTGYVLDDDDGGGGGV